MNSNIIAQYSDTITMHSNVFYLYSNYITMQLKNISYSTIQLRPNNKLYSAKAKYFTNSVVRNR